MKSLNERLVVAVPVGAEKTCSEKLGSCVTPTCKKTFGLMGAVFVLLILAMYGTYYVTNMVDQSMYVHDNPPAAGCSKNNTIQMGKWYFGQKKPSLYDGSFMYAASFVPNTTFASTNGNIVLGNMYICTQVTGSMAVTPYNCSNSFVFDYGLCSLGVIISQCSTDGADTKTDMHFVWVAYDSGNDQIDIEFSSHFPSAGGLIALSPTSDQPIACPNA
eukprot:c33459_g1_i1.p1 GENE.c33459_g1_i1~~c33459_g1_i1.p1  ORF type:complete len:217 (+),score=96.36 c33459_g1_i1:146-796(+)